MEIATNKENYYHTSQIAFKLKDIIEVAMYEYSRDSGCMGCFSQPCDSLP